VLNVALAGNVGSGKSTVAEFWANAGVPIISADELAREAVVTGSPGLEAVRESFGEGVLGAIASGSTGWVLLWSVVVVVVILVARNLLLRIAGPSDQVSVGLTGNIAAGKSTVAEIWADEGIPVLCSDELAREVVMPDSGGLKDVERAFGRNILNQDGSLDREALSALVFSEDEARRQLERILHPRIGVLRDRWMRKQLSSRSPLTVCEVPLLFETGLESEFDVSVFVDSSEEIRLARL
ncbi:uncharacterized protein METZ01_LOCUS222880, partial [marine metagenome]